MITINVQTLAKAQKEVDERLSNLNFPKLRIMPLDRNIHCEKCENKQGIWYHKCSNCHLTLPTHVAFSNRKPKTSGHSPHQSWCRKCMKGRQPTKKTKAKTDGHFGDLTMSEILALPPRKIEIALMNARNEADKLRREIVMLERLMGKEI